MEQAGPSRAALVDDRVNVRVAGVTRGLSSSLPSGRHICQLCVREVSKGCDMPWRVDDDLLPLEGGVEVWDDSDRPAGRVGRALLGQGEGLRRRSVFAALVKRAALELLRGLRLDLRPRSPGSVGPARSDDDLAAGERVDAKIDGQLLSVPPAARWRSGPISSIGSGRIRVDVRSELISSIVCR